MPGWPITAMFHTITLLSTKFMGTVLPIEGVEMDVGFMAYVGTGVPSDDP